MSDIVKKDIINGSTVDEVMVNLDVDYERLLKLLNPQNRHILKINNSHWLFNKNIYKHHMINRNKFLL